MNMWIEEFLKLRIMELRIAPYIFPSISQKHQNGKMQHLIIDYPLSPVPHLKAKLICSIFMEKGKSKNSTDRLLISTCFENLQLNHNNNKNVNFPELKIKNKRKDPPSLLSLCLGLVGTNLEDIIDDLSDISLIFPSDIKMVLVAIARRRNLLNDDVLIALADSSWEILDISGSDVTDYGLCHVVNICRNLRAADISRCSRLTYIGAGELIQRCHSLEILRWGGCPRNEQIARRCLSLLKPDLNNVEGDSWEELDASDLTQGAQSLRWLVWPKIDKDSLESLTSECPRIVVNPKPSPFDFRGALVPKEALIDFTMDDPIVKDIDPRTWAVLGSTTRVSTQLVSDPSELSVAEKFRLAFLERDTRLAPKRAKNARQHQRRAEREIVMMNSRVKALALASRASKSVNFKNL